MKSVSHQETAAKSDFSYRFQRSTHFLQLPYERAIPLIIYSCLLRWLRSQSIFVSRLEVHGPTGNLIPDSSICACGCSLASLFATALALILGIACLGFIIIKSTPENIPFGANSSLILSAACHPPPDDVQPYKKLLQWGVVESRLGRRSIAHCTLTSTKVTAPVADTAYA